MFWRMTASGRVILLFIASALAADARGQIGQFDAAKTDPRQESYVFTPLGFDQEGKAAVAEGPNVAVVKVTVLDPAHERPTPCRVNVVGSDGNYYFPAQNPFAPFSLLGNWPDGGKGNRPAKEPIRYFGHFFYTTGPFEVRVPAGQTRIEAWRGFEHAPQSTVVQLNAGETRDIALRLPRTVDLAEQGYYGGDPHLHFDRVTDDDERTIFDLLAAEDIRFGLDMCYNETDRYTGEMSHLVTPQRRGMGRRSAAVREGYHLLSGQEYRNGVYGHINLYWRDDLVLVGQTLDPNHWPVYGVVARQTRALGGFAFYAHGGYAQEIYADVVQDSISGVELLQFGIYRGIGLEGWYHILNAGYRFPALGASDYPACRKLGDCRTYAAVAAKDERSDTAFLAWLQAAAQGRSFVTTAPLLLLDVEGHGPGAVVPLTQPTTLSVKLRVTSPTAPVTHVQLIVNGRVQGERRIDPRETRGGWFQGHERVTVDRPCWIAARAYSKSPFGTADAEAHTNPVYVYLDGRRPFDAAAADWLIEKLDAQIAFHQQREFRERPLVVEYFQKSRQALEDLKRSGGLTAEGK